jgi:hypothetical protein
MTDEGRVTPEAQAAAPQGDESVCIPEPIMPAHLKDQISVWPALLLMNSAIMGLADPVVWRDRMHRARRPTAWLPFLDTYRTMCRAPEPAFRSILEGIRDLRFAS